MEVVKFVNAFWLLTFWNSLLVLTERKSLALLGGEVRNRKFWSLYAKDNLRMRILFFSECATYFYIKADKKELKQAKHLRTTIKAQSGGF